MWELLGSGSVLGGAVLLAELLRRGAGRGGGGAAPRSALLEAAAAFQLCASCQELVLLGPAVPLPLGLLLGFLVTLLQLRSCRGASGNPAAPLEAFCRGRCRLRVAAAVLAAQFAAAVAARCFASSVWSLGLSELHDRHRRSGLCWTEPPAGSVLEAAAMELSGAFIIQAAAAAAETALHEQVRANCLAAVITALVHTGGGISGAMYNPVLASSIQLPCSSHSPLEFLLIYGLGPLLGVSSCILLLEKLLPFLSGHGHDDVLKHKSH